MKTFKILTKIFLIVLCSLICNLNGMSLKRKEDQQLCPQGFTKFQKHCFYISKERVSTSDAKETCKKVGGHQVWISDRKKEKIVVKYLRANRRNIQHRYHYVWLPSAKGGGRTLKWIDSGQNAKVFLYRHGYYSTRFSDSNRPNLFMTIFGDVRHCKRHCKPLQAFCETNMVATNNTNSKPTVDIKNVKQTKPRKSKPKGRKKNLKQSKPRTSKPKGRKKNPKQSKPKTSKPIGRKKNLKQSKPRKSKPKGREKNLKQTKPRKSNKGKSKPTERKKVTSYPVSECPQGFTKFRKHCFYISKEKGSRSDAKEICKKVGGHQVWISDRKKEKIVVKYLRANRGNIQHHSPYVWLPSLKGGGMTLNWTDSGQNAKDFMNRHSYYGTRFSYRNRPDVFITIFGDVHHCKSDCKPLQAFCETNMVVKNNKKANATNRKRKRKETDTRKWKPETRSPDSIYSSENTPRKSKLQKRRVDFYEVEDNTDDDYENYP